MNIARVVVLLWLAYLALVAASMAGKEQKPITPSRTMWAIAELMLVATLVTRI